MAEMEMVRLNSYLLRYIESSCGKGLNREIQADDAKRRFANTI